jgi:hypothetical protein
MASKIVLAENLDQRICTLTESKVNVGLVLRIMLGPADALTYLASAKVPPHVVTRVINAPYSCRDHVVLESSGEHPPQERSTTDDRSP